MTDEQRRINPAPWKRPDRTGTPVELEPGVWVMAMQSLSPNGEADEVTVYWTGPSDVTRTSAPYPNTWVEDPTRAAVFPTAAMARAVLTTVRRHTVTQIFEQAGEVFDPSLIGAVVAEIADKASGSLRRALRSQRTGEPTPDVQFAALCDVLKLAAALRVALGYEPTPLPSDVRAEDRKAALGELANAARLPLPDRILSMLGLTTTYGMPLSIVVSQLDAQRQIVAEQAGVQIDPVSVEQVADALAVLRRDGLVVQLPGGDGRYVLASYAPQPEPTGDEVNTEMMMAIGAFLRHRGTVGATVEEVVEYLTDKQEGDPDPIPVGHPHATVWLAWLAKQSQASQPEPHGRYYASGSEPGAQTAH